MRESAPVKAASLDPVEQARSWLASQGVESDSARLAFGTGDGDQATGPGARSEARAKQSSGDPAAGTGTRCDEQSAERDADPETMARAILLRQLAARARTRHELEGALAKRNVPEGVAAGVLDRFEAVGLVDDAAFARQWVASRQARRHLSRGHLRQELQRKGVSRDDIEAALADVDWTDEMEAARALGRKKLQTLGEVDEATRYRRLAGVLARRGFPAATVAAVLAELLGR